MRLILVDQLNLVSQSTQLELQKLGWQPELVTADVFTWLPNCPADSDAAIFANLFLHHFSESQLRGLFSQSAAKCVFFAACDPRRSVPALLASHVLRVIGCNAVTRHDAVVSVHAGFRGTELSKLWSQADRWQLLEKEAGLFSHAFLARKNQ